MSWIYANILKETDVREVKVILKNHEFHDETTSIGLPT